MAMIVVISPAKTLYPACPAEFEKYSEADFLPEAEKIVSVLRKKKPPQLARLMDISPKLAELNFHRFQEWELPFTTENSWPAIFMFNGDLYQGLNAVDFSEPELETAQQTIRILSGLYGLLKPLDLIRPYRLEMGTDIPVARKKNLYDFWKTKITTRLNQEIRQNESKYLINLASNEYFGAIDPKKLKATIITPEFREYREGKHRMISFFAKRARGLMSRFIIENRIGQPDDLKAFEAEGYHFNNQLSNSSKYVFTR